jgi:hypothetical protein
MTAFVAFTVQMQRESDANVQRMRDAAWWIYEPVGSEGIPAAAEKLPGFRQQELCAAYYSNDEYTVQKFLDDAHVEDTDYSINEALKDYCWNR